jgi:hypothetical protein
VCTVVATVLGVMSPTLHRWLLFVTSNFWSLAAGLNWQVYFLTLNSALYVDVVMLHS